MALEVGVSVCLLVVESTKHETMFSALTGGVHTRSEGASGAASNVSGSWPAGAGPQQRKTLARSAQEMRGDRGCRGKDTSGVERSTLLCGSVRDFESSLRDESAEDVHCVM